MLEVKRTPSGSYRQDWAAYNAAQTNEKPLFLRLLRELCQGVDDIERPKEHSRLPLQDILFCMVFKGYSTLSSRRFDSELEEAKAKGFISVVSHFNSISNYMKLESLKPILQQLVRESASPLRAIENRFAADSTGLGTPLRPRYYDRHKGRFRVKRVWVKLHAMCGVETNIITSAEVSDGDANDGPFFQGLVRDTARYFEMSEVYADGGTRVTPTAATCSSGGPTRTYIAFRSNNVEDGAPKSEIWKRMLREFRDKESEFWKRYYNRNNVEATFSMMKRKFRDRLRSKTFAGQVNEALCKVLCHNLCVVIQSMFELGIAPEFYTDVEVRQPPHGPTEQEARLVRERIAALTVRQPTVEEFTKNMERDEQQAGDAGGEDSPSTPAPKAEKKSRKKKEGSVQTKLLGLESLSTVRAVLSYSNGKT